MKRFASLMGVLSTFLLTTTAQGWLQPCPGQFGFQAEYLYLYPCTDDPFYAIDYSDSPAVFAGGDRIPNTFGFHSGVRLEGVYAFCDSCYDARIRWTYLHAKEHDKVLGSNNNLTTLAPARGQEFCSSADSVVRLTYDTIEALLGQQVVNGCGPLNLYAHLGLQYSYIHWNNGLVYENTYDPESVSIELVRYSSNVWGLGPELALSGNYALCHLGGCCPGSLSVTGLATASLLVSEYRSKFFAGVIGDDFPEYEVEDQHNWRIIPTWHLRFGLNYATRLFCCVNTSLEVGYEFTTFYKGISMIRFVDSGSNGLSFNEYSDLGLHGPYAALSFAF